MSEETNPTPVVKPDYASIVEQIDPVTQEPFKQVDNGHRLIKKSFNKALAGITFFVPEFLDLAVAVEKYGADKILSMVNDNVHYAIRLKVKNGFPTFEGADSAEKTAAYFKNLVAANPLQFTEEQAESFVPGEREITFNGLMNRAKALMNEGKTTEALEVMKKAMELAEKLEQEAQLKSQISES